jgi:hypothetical protein
MRLFCGASLAVVVLFAACTAGERISSLREGMTQPEVVGVMGSPDGFLRSGDYEALTYTDRLISGWSWDRTDYSVILLDGRVVAYGNGEVREEAPKTLVIVPLIR